MLLYDMKRESFAMPYFCGRYDIRGRCRHACATIPYVASRARVYMWKMYMLNPTRGNIKQNPRSYVDHIMKSMRVLGFVEDV